MRSVLAAGLLALTVSTAPAAAATFVNVGDTYTAYINGLSDDYGGGTTPVPGLLAELTFTFKGFSGQFANFDYAVKNTSVLPFTSSTVKVFGFDVTSATVVAGSTATGDYSKVLLNNGSGFPNVGGINRLFELCVSSRDNANNCGGGGNEGTELGATDVGTLSIKLAAVANSVELNNFGVRWQELTAPTLGLRGASGVGDEYTPHTPSIPEPAAWALMIAGFGLVGAAMRRRQSIVQMSA